MDKRQQRIVVIIALATAVGMGAVAYSQFTSVSGRSALKQTSLEMTSRKAPDAPVAPVVMTDENPLPDGTLLPDEVVKGIEADLREEEGSLKDETTVEKGAATEGAAVLNDYGNVYDETKL